ncbi:MAG: hypothetical protein ACYC67_20905 [Prosthecobacter sp.]|jgi:hypothetical protein
MKTMLMLVGALLFDDPAQGITLGCLRHQLDTWIADTHDQGAIPEDPHTVANELKRNAQAESKLRGEFGLGPNDVLLKTLDQPAKNP